MSNLINKYKSWREQLWFKIFSMALKLALAAVILLVLIGKADIKIENFAGLDMRWIAAALLAILLQNFLTAVRWWYLMRSVGVKASLFEALSLTMQGLFYTLFIPGGSVSGDVVKAALMAGKSADGSKFAAAFSVLIDRVCGLCGLLLLSFIAASAVLLLDIAGNGLFKTLLTATAIIAPCALICAVMAFRCDVILKIKLFKKLYDFLDKISKGAIGRIENALAAYRPAWKTVLAWTLISGLIAFPLIALAVWFIAAACPDSGGWSSGSCVAGALLSGSIGELAGILPLTPGGIGVRDAVFVEIFKACGLPGGVATQIPVLFTTLFVLASSTGAFFALYMLIVKRRKR